MANKKSTRAKKSTTATNIVVTKSAPIMDNHDLIELIGKDIVSSDDLEVILESTRNPKDKNPLIPDMPIKNYLPTYSGPESYTISQQDIDVLNDMFEPGKANIKKMAWNGIGIKKDSLPDLKKTVPIIHEAIKSGKDYQIVFDLKFKNQSNTPDTSSQVASTSGVDLNDFNTYKTGIENRLSGIDSRLNGLPSVYNKSDIDTKLNAINSDLSNKLDKTALGNAIVDKVNESLLNIYTKDQIDSLLNDLKNAISATPATDSGLSNKSIINYITNKIEPFLEKIVEEVNKAHGRIDSVIGDYATVNNLYSLIDSVDKTINSIKKNQATNDDLDTAKSELNAMINNLNTDVDNVTSSLSDYAKNSDVYSRDEVNALFNDKSYLKQFILDELSDPSSELSQYLDLMDKQKLSKGDLDNALESLLSNPKSKLFKVLSGIESDKLSKDDLDHEFDKLLNDPSSEVYNQVKKPIDDLTDCVNQVGDELVDLSNNFNDLKSEFNAYKTVFDDLAGNLDSRISEQLENGAECKRVLTDLLNGYATTGDLAALRTDFGNYKNSLKIVLNGIDTRINELSDQISVYSDKYEVLDEFIGNALNDIDARIGSIVSYDPNAVKTLIQDELSAGAYVKASDLQSKLDALNLSLSADESAKLSDLMNVSVELKSSSEAILDSVKAYSEGVVKTYESVANTYTEVKNFVSSLVPKAPAEPAKAPVSA